MIPQMSVVTYFHAPRSSIPNVSKSDIIFTYVGGTCFSFAIAQSNKDIGLKLHVCCLYAYNIYTQFLDNLQNQDFLGIYFQKMTFTGQNRKKTR